MPTVRTGLEQLFGSETRLKLLRIFLHNPEESFFVRELVRRLGTQIHAVRRELMNLERLGVIQPTAPPPGDPTARLARGPESQRKYYRADTEHLLFPELKALVVKADLLLREDLVRRMRAAGTVTLLILTGRFLGIRHASTDMLVVGLVNKKALKSLIAECERSFGHEVNYTVLTPREFKYRKEVTDRFLYEILEGKKIVLVDSQKATSSS